MRALGLIEILVAPFCSYASPIDARDRALQTQQQEVGYVEKCLLYDAITDQPIVTLKEGDVINVATMKQLLLVV